MKIVVYQRTPSFADQHRVVALVDSLLLAGHEVTNYDSAAGIPDGTDMLMAVGGDGTFLTSAMIVGDSGVPVLGVNLGRVGFLSENVPEMVASALSSKTWTIEKRTLLSIEGVDTPWPYALNEFSVHRSAAQMLGIDVTINGAALPTYWADGLLVATSSGSTAYSLSVGGPIALPESKVLIIAPIAPHNLNVRPLIVPDTAEITMKFRSRDSRVDVEMDNRAYSLSTDGAIRIKMAHFSLNRVCLKDSDFIKALTTKLFWGEDIRNRNEQ